MKTIDKDYDQNQSLKRKCTVEYHQRRNGKKLEIWKINRKEEWCIDKKAEDQVQSLEEHQLPKVKMKKHAYQWTHIVYDLEGMTRVKKKQS